MVIVLTVSIPVTGAGGVSVQGTGTLTLSGANTYTGGTTIASGATLMIGNTGLMGNPGAAAGYTNTLVNNGTFIFANNTQAIGSAETISGVISGSGTVNALNCVATTGTTAPGGQLSLTASAGNTYTGITTITNGYLLIVNDNGLGTPPVNLVANQLTLNMPLDGHIYGLRLQNNSTTLNANRGVYLGADGSGVIGGAFNARRGRP